MPSIVGAYVVAFPALLVSLLIPLASDSPFNQVGRVVIACCSAYFLTRAPFMGIYVRGDCLKIVSWFWNHRLSLSELDSVDATNYGGILTRGSNSSWISSRLQVLTVRVAFDERERRYESPFMTRRAAAGIIAALELGLSEPS